MINMAVRVSMGVSELGVLLAAAAVVGIVAGVWVGYLMGRWGAR